MGKIKDVIFDFGGVLVESNQQQAAERFKKLGLKDADKRLDKYHQTGIFGDVEEGKIDSDGFINELEKLTGRKLTFDMCAYAWQGYCSGVPQRNLDLLKKLRKEGYRLCLLSNNNPFFMSWARSKEFDGCGHSLDYYLDHIYLSYEMKMVKPDERIFKAVLSEEGISADEAMFIDDGERNIKSAAAIGINTILVKEGENWQSELCKQLYEFKNKQ